MTVYQNTIANLGVKLEITHASPDIANNRTTITYKASVYKTGSHNPYNLLSQTPMYLTINGQSLYSTSSGNYDLRGSTYEQTIKSGTLVIPHNSDGSKSFSFSWNVNFTSTGYGYGNVTTSGTYVLPNIARASTFTIPSTTITTGSAFTVSISRASSSFTHKVSYIVGNNETRWTSNATTSYTATVPHLLFNAHKSTSSVSGVIRVTTMNGSSVVGSNQRAVTINLVSTAKPTVGSLSNSNSNKSLFSNASQYIRGLSRLTATAGSVSGSYSSTIASYEFRVVRANGTTMFGTTSQTTNKHQFSAFDFPNSGSEVVTPQVRVRDSRGRYSAWRAASAIRVHYYAPPAIGTMTVRRVGSANTTLQVTRNYSITLLYESGTGSNKNTASLRFQHRTKGSTGATDNAGAKSTTTSLSNRNANLSGTFATGTSYEVRAILSDKINTVYGSWISVGTEFVPMDIGPKGVGVGKVHSNGSYDLEVGAGGINSEGSMFLGGNLNMGQHNRVSSAPIRINFGRVSDYHKAVVALSRLDENGSYSIGKVMASRDNGLYGATQADVTFTSRYNSDSVYADVINYGPNQLKACTFKYDGVLYAGLEIYPGNAQYHYIEFHGMSNVNPFKVDYYDTRGTVLNSEINNSISFTANIERSNNLLYGNNKVWHAGNDGSGSGLDADLLDGLHASSFMRSNVSVPTITSGTNGNGNWYNINGVLLICWHRFSITGKLTNSQMNGTWTYPMPFAYAPAVSIGSRADDNTNSTNGYRRAGSTAFHQYNESTTKTDILYAVNNGDVPTNPRKYINIFAIGTPA